MIFSVVSLEIGMGKSPITEPPAPINPDNIPTSVISSTNTNTPYRKWYD